MRLRKHNLAKFKADCEKTFEETHYDKYKSMPHEIYDSVVWVFRAFFNLFDKMITKARGADKTMAESYNPLARKLFGQDHVLTYSKEEPKYPSRALGKLRKDFSEALEQLEKTTLSPAPVLGGFYGYK